MYKVVRVFSTGNVGILLDDETHIIVCNLVYYEPGLGVGVPIPKGAEIIPVEPHVVIPYDEALFKQHYSIELMTICLHAEWNVPRWLLYAYWKRLGFDIHKTPLEIDVKYGILLNKICDAFKKTNIMNNPREAQAQVSIANNFASNEKFIQEHRRHWPAPFKNKFPRAEYAKELRSLLERYPIFCGLHPEKICTNLNHIIYLTSVDTICQQLENMWNQK